MSLLEQTSADNSFQYARDVSLVHSSHFAFTCDFSSADSVSVCSILLTCLDSPDSQVKSSRAHSVATGSIFDPTALNQAQFTNLLEKFLGELPPR